MAAEEFEKMSIGEIQALHLPKEELEKISIGKRLKMLDDYSAPVKFGDFLWHILSIKKASALLMMTQPLEKVDLSFISKKLKLFLRENFSQADKDALRQELRNLTIEEAHKYLDANERVIGRHWWVEKRTYGEPICFECVNAMGRDDSSSFISSPCLRPVAEVKIPFCSEDTEWNEIWENATVSEVNFIGKWTAVVIDKEEREYMLSFAHFETESKSSESIVIMPRIDVSDM